jgi:hypothetical protein
MEYLAYLRGIALADVLFLQRLLALTGVGLVAWSVYPGLLGGYSARKLWRQ